MDLNLYLYLALFLLLVGLFFFSLFKSRREEAREQSGRSTPETGPVNAEGEERGEGE